MGLTIFCEIFPILDLNGGIFCIILSIPQNIVMDPNNVMKVQINAVDKGK